MTKKNEQKEIASALKKVKGMFKRTDKEIVKLLRDDPKVSKGVENLKDHEIPISILYQLYWYSNRNWIIATTETSKNKVAIVRIWRDFRDLCDEEITRRQK